MHRPPDCRSSSAFFPPPPGWLGQVALLAGDVHEPNRSAILRLRQLVLSTRGDRVFLALGNRKRLQLFPYHTHLLAGLLEGAGVVDHIIGGFDFFCFGELRCHATLDFLAREVEQ